MTTKTLSLRIDEELIDNIDAHVADGKSRNAVIKDLIEAGLEVQSGKKSDEERLRELMEELVGEASEKMSETVSQKIREENNELFRDWSQQLVSAVLPAAIAAGNQKLLEELKPELEELKPALPDPQAELEGSEEEEVAAETEVEPEEEQVEKKGILQWLADVFK